MGFKLFSPNVSKNFGESFNATVDRERKLKQQQDQFNKDMAFRNRQLGLLNIYRESSVGIDQGNLDARNREQDFREIPKPISPTEQARTRPLGGGIVEERYFEDAQGNETITGYESLISPDRSGGKDKDKTPLYDLSGSGKAFNEYREFEKTAERTEEGIDVVGQKDLMSSTQFEGMKGGKLQAVIDATDNEARKINSKVPGFYGVFQEIMGARGQEIEVDGKRIAVTKENVDKVVNVLFKGQSSETRDAMKTLLKRRIF